MKGRTGLKVWGGALVALSSAVGGLVGLRSVVALELPRVRTLLSLPDLPREGLGLTWSTKALWPAEIQSLALSRLTGLLTALFLAAVGVALLNALILLFEAGASRRREAAIRAALGEGPWPVTRRLLTDVRRLLITGLALGLLLGMAWGGALRGAWPGVVGAVGWLDATWTLVPVVGLLMALAAVAYVGTGVGVSRGRSLARSLMSGERATAAPGEAFQRRTLAALQTGMAGAVTLGALALVMGLGDPAAPSGGAAGTVVAGVTAPANSPAAWARLGERLARLPGLEAESLSTPGTLVGLGVRDNATAQCGDCYRGLMYLPFWGAVADHHAVGPGFFELAGMTLAEGRGFTRADGPERPRVAVVNRTFANTAFENGRPIGRKVRLGTRLDAWYEVVGVVEDQPIVGLGGDDMARSAVYVSSLQHPPGQADLLLAGSEEAISEAVAVAASLGFSPSEPRPLRQVRSDARTPLRWVGRLGLVLALLTLGLAVHGAHATALQVTRRRVRELAVRRALGATDAGIVRHVLAGAAGTALGGSVVAVFFGTLGVALLRKVVGGLPALSPLSYSAVLAVVLGVGLLASAKAAREAVAVEPGLVVE